MCEYVNCRFANFSLLILFYIQVLTGKQWQLKWRTICLPLYLVLTMSMATFTVVWALNSSNDLDNAVQFGDKYDEEFYKVMGVRVQLEYSAFSFFLLGTLFGLFGWKLINVSLFERRCTHGSAKLKIRPFDRSKGGSRDVYWYLGPGYVKWWNFLLVR